MTKNEKLQAIFHLYETEHESSPFLVETLRGS